MERFWSALRKLVILGDKIKLLDFMLENQLKR